MCGIAGYGLAPQASPPDAMLLARMAEALVHRGPDGVGLMNHAQAGLASRRLAVLDPAGGSQPVWNEDRSVAVVMNGEIYNFASLRSDLIARGHLLASHADTEVIPHLYEEYGVDCIERLEGMFALAVWDARRRQLLLARDRLGVKPLYYHANRQRLLFASEIKALLQDDQIPRQVNLSALDSLLTFGYMMPGTSGFAGIQELPPASYLVYRDGRFRGKTYWSLPTASAPIVDRGEALEQFLEALHAAVQRRLVSDVPLGAFLSGGIDSGLIVALTRSLSDAPLPTFSIGFEERAFCELPRARQVAARYRTDHHELIVRPQLAGILPKLIQAHDAPFYDTSAIPMYYLCQLARQHVTVALSGDGGDELFAGYNVFRAHQVAERFRRTPRWLQGLVRLAACRVPETSGYLNYGRVAREFLQGCDGNALQRYARWTSKIKRETRQQLYRHQTLRQLGDLAEAQRLEPFAGRGAASSSLQRLLQVAATTELPQDMLVKVDRMSMACSLEVRSPLLDHRLFELAARLPDSLKLNGLRSKYLLRRIASRYLPRNIAWGPKRGFSIPLDRWLRTELSELVQDVLLDARTAQRGYFEPAAVQRLVADHMRQNANYGRELWTLTTIELWHRMYIDALDVRIAHPPARTATAALAK